MGKARTRSILKPSTLSEESSKESALDWWKIIAVRYPTVEKLAQEILCLCTSVAVECVFSCEDNINSYRQENLS